MDRVALNTYQSEDGPVEVPVHPERVIVLSTYAGNVISLGVPLVGVDVWSKKSPIFEKDLKDVAEVISEPDKPIIKSGLSSKESRQIEANSSYRYFHLREIGLFNATFILYQKMKLNMPSRVKEVALKKGYYAISSEVLSEFVGDYVIFSKDRDGNTSFAFQETSTYKNIPAVKNHHVF